MTRGPRMGGGPMMAMQGGAKAKNFKSTLMRLVRFSSDYWLQLIFIFLLAIAGTIFAIFSPRLLGDITSKIFEGAIMMAMGVPGASIDMDYVSSMLLIMLALYIASSAFTYFQSFLMAGVAQKITYAFRRLITEKISKVPLKYYDSEPFGDILSRITNDVDTIANSLQQSVTSVVTSVTTVIGILIMMLTINVPMTMISLISLPVSLILIGAIVKVGQNYFRQRAAKLGELNGMIEENFGAHSIVKAFNAEKRSIEKFDKLSDSLTETTWKAEFISGMMMPIISFISNLSYVAVVVLGGYLVVDGKIRVGDIQSFIQYTRNFSQPINQTAQIANVLQSTVAAAERVFEFLDEDEEPKESTNPATLEQVEGSVTFENVSFGYSPDNVFIQQLNIDVKPGQRIAIVGPTGAGKTTLINLLMRFYDVNQGSIKIDGVDIRDLKRKDLRKIFGMVLQDTWLFNGSIRENIAFSNHDATFEEIVRAADNAKADHFIKTLPDGYDMVINEEASNISAGQKQLLTIARAFLADPAILILDEATSSVDTRTEVLIQKAMSKLMRGRTSFIIAHRLSTIRDADNILVINQGSVIEQGTHAELMAKSGFYAQLYQSQFEFTSA
ncbi:MAG: ABC transporter ATP-binding protein [Erysipelotrichaceae bacterium]|nr:ABC transporter ATP-binding protein [Erysipelotrichaceae bacterium]MDP3305414.1 ABC transporter ATP-binding protein [Erysipelotrichaceae bacterium]